MKYYITPPLKMLCDALRSGEFARHDSDTPKKWWGKRPEYSPIGVMAEIARREGVYVTWERWGIGPIYSITHKTEENLREHFELTPEMYRQIELWHWRGDDFERIAQRLEAGEHELFRQHSNGCFYEATS